MQTIYSLFQTWLSLLLSIFANFESQQRVSKGSTYIYFIVTNNHENAMTMTLLLLKNVCCSEAVMQDVFYSLMMTLWWLIQFLSRLCFICKLVNMEKMTKDFIYSMRNILHPQHNFLSKTREKFLIRSLSSKFIMCSLLFDVFPFLTKDSNLKAARRRWYSNFLVNNENNFRLHKQVLSLSLSFSLLFYNGVCVCVMCVYPAFGLSSRVSSKNKVLSCQGTCTLVSFASGPTLSFEDEKVYTSVSVFLAA